MGTIKKGKIASTKSNFARIVNGNTISNDIAIPWYLRGIKKETSVIYVEFEDSTGMILSREDGNWSKTLEVDNININGTDFSEHIHDVTGDQTSPPKVGE